VGFWSGETLRRRGKALISDFRDDNVEYNAYALELGSEYFCTSDRKQGIFGDSSKKYLEPGGTLSIYPGQFAFLKTKQTVTVPPDSMAFISMKATYKFEGLINVSGFHVDPGFGGQLLFSVYNAGASPIPLVEGMRLFLIWYSYLDDQNPDTVHTPSIEIRKPGSKDITRDLIKNMSVGMLSLNSLAEDVASVKARMATQWVIFGASSILFLAIVAGIAVIPITHAYESMTAKKEGGPSAPASRAPVSSASAGSSQARQANQPPHHHAARNSRSASNSSPGL
jgi:dCTP deaminase